METIQVLIVDDHTLVRAGIVALIKQMPGIAVLAEAGSGREALRLLRHLRPDLALLDIAMPGMNGLETTQRILQEFPQVKVVILSMHGGEDSVWAAMHAGAAGYVIKGGSPQELEAAIRTVAGGGIYVASTARELAGQKMGACQEVGFSAIERLTRRQREILQLIGEGYPASHIAERLQISVKTVDTHRAHIMRRLRIHDIAGLVRFAIRTGVTTL